MKFSLLLLQERPNYFTTAGRYRGKMNIRVLVLVLVSYLCSTQLQGRYITPDNCLKLDQSNNCVCCSPGYRGQTCGDKCNNCLSRHSSVRGCMYYCRTGFYGTRCNEICPKTCANSVSGPHACSVRDGVLTCANGCVAGFYGTQCDKGCSTMCLNDTCYQATGTCIECSDEHYHGDHCNKPCSKGCKNQICERSGKCIDGCHFGYHGVDCRSKCGSNCVDGLCVSDMNYTYNCTRGCQDGFRGVNCSELCTSELDGCSLHLSDTRENVKALASIPLVIIAVVLAATTAAVIIFVCWWKKRHASFLCFEGSHHEATREKVPLLGRLWSYNATRHGQSDPKKDNLDNMIEEKRGTFVVTSIYNTVETCLEEHGHVTISGASGEGKTSLALMIGDEYRKKGYKLLFVDDPETFTLDTDYTEKTVCIFDDIFRAERLGTPVSQLQKLFRQLQVRIENSKETATEEMIKRGRQTSNHANEGRTFYVIFTTKSFNLRCAMSKLIDHDIYLFRSQTVCDLTTTQEYKYNTLEKRNIFNKHKTHNKDCRDFPVEEICEQELSMFGFPMICNLFFKVFFQEDILRFFSKPLEYLEIELKSILDGSKENAAVLMLMILFEDGLNLIELESDHEHIRNKLDKVQTLLGHLNREEILSAARRFQGTFFTKGDISYFSHPAVKDASTFVIFDKFPGFILKNCCLKFLYERIHSDFADTTARERGDYTIHISEASSDIIIGRLAEGIKQGHYNMTISHPILKNRAIVDKLFTKMRQSVNDSDSDHTRPTYLHSNDKDKCFLHWAAQANSLYFLEQILRIEPDFSPKEVEEAVEACTSSGNVQVLDLLLQRFSQLISKELIGSAFIQAACTGQHDLFQCLVDKTLDITPGCMFPGTTGDTLLHIACKGGNKSIVKQILSSGVNINSVDNNGFTPIMNAVYNEHEEVFNLLLSGDADVTLTNQYNNTVLHLACRGRNTSIVKHLLQSFDINIRGMNGWTPVMNAAKSGKKEVFDLLMTKGADLTLTSNYGNTVLHHGCLGGNTSIVKHLLPAFDINICGENGWTPVMIAAKSGKTEVFHLLVTKGADLTLTDNYGNTVLHLACQGGNTSIVQHLLPSFDINIRGHNGWSPVMNAAISGKKEVFDLLVTKGADLTLTDNNGNTVLHLACWGGNTSIVKHLLPSFDINICGDNGWTPVMNAAKSGKKEVFDLLETKEADLTLTSNSGNTVLHLACQGGNTSIVKHLLPSFGINIRGENGWTPVMNAAKSGKKEVFDLLVTKGADLTLTVNSDDTVLHLACHGGNTSIVKHLLPSFDINICGDNGWTPVMNAAISGKKEVFDLLVSKGADLTLIDNYGNTVLHLACWGGNTSIVKHLLPSFDINIRGKNGWTPVMNAANSGKKKVFDLLVTKGADLTLTAKDRYTILHSASEGGSVDIVKYVLPRFDINIRGGNGQTPLTTSVSGGHIEVFDILVSNGADVTVVDDDGDDLLHLACEKHNLDMVEHVLSLCDINGRDKLGLTPAMVALLNGHEKVFEYLVDNGADLTAVDDAGDDMLTMAYRGGCKNVIQKLNQTDSGR